MGCNKQREEKAATLSVRAAAFDKDKRDCYLFLSISKAIKQNKEIRYSIITVPLFLLYRHLYGLYRSSHLTELQR